MPLSFDWLGIADAAASDSRGALTLVAVGHNVIVAPSLPHQEQRVVVITILDEETAAFPFGEPCELDFQVTGPDGKMVMSNRQTLTLDPKANPFGRHPKLPPRGFQLVVGLGFHLTEYGEYLIRAVVTVAGQELERSRRLYVVESPEHA